MLGGIAVGGYLFSDSQPRSFLALSNCVSCYRPNDLWGLLASAGIQRAPGAIPLAVKETDRCVAIEHPYHSAKFHFVVFPKKDIKVTISLSKRSVEFFKSEARKISRRAPVNAGG